MADQVTLPAIGPVPKKWLVIGGAVTAGVVGYAYIRARSGSSTPAPVTAGEATGVTDDTVLPTGATGSATGTYDATGGGTISTNAQWTTQAVSSMGGIGFDPTSVAAALGKYLGRQPLNLVEQGYVRTAIGLTGPPPVGGPYSVSDGAVTDPAGYVGPARRNAASSTAAGLTGFIPDASNFEQIELGHYDNVAPPGPIRRVQVMKLASLNGYNPVSAAYDKRRKIRLPATL